MTARVRVVLKAANGNALCPERYSQAAECSSPFSNQRLTGYERSCGRRPLVEVTARSSVHEWNEQTIDGIGFAGTIGPVYARGRLAGPGPAERSSGTHQIWLEMCNG